MNPAHSRGGLGRFILTPLAVVAMLALATTSVAFAAQPDKSHPPEGRPSASVNVDGSSTPEVDESEAPEVDESEAPDVDGTEKPEASGSPGACNALNGNAAEVIKALVTNWPTKHAKGDRTVTVPAGLQKVADRLAACLGEDWSSPSASPDASASPSPIVVGDEKGVRHTGKALGRGHNH